MNSAAKTEMSIQSMLAMTAKKKINKMTKMTDKCNGPWQPLNKIFKFMTRFGGEL